MNEYGQFEIGIRSQRVWGALSDRGGFVLLAFFIGGVGCATYILSAFTNYWPGLVVGFVLVAIVKNVLHFADATHPGRMGRAFMNVRFSWISRGAVAIPVFAVASGIDAAPFLLAGLPWSSPPLPANIPRIIAMVAALVIMIYPGLLLSSFRAFPFWNSASFPLIFTLLQFLGGVGLAGLSFAFAPPSPEQSMEVLTVSIIALAVTIATVASHIFVSLNSQVVARKSVEVLLKSKFSILFATGAIILGLVTPLFLLTSAYALHTTSWTNAGLSIASLLLLSGSFIHSYGLLRGGIRKRVGW